MAEDLMTVSALAVMLGWHKQKVRRTIWALGIQPAEFRREVFITNRGRRRAAVAYFEQSILEELRKFDNEDKVRTEREAKRPLQEGSV